MKQTGLLLLLVVVAILYVNVSTAQGPGNHPQPKPKDHSPDDRSSGRQIVKRAAQINPDNMPMPKMPNPSDFKNAATNMGSMFSGIKRRFVRSPQGTPQLMYAGEAPSDDAEAEGKDEGPHGHGPPGHGPHGPPPFKHGPPCSKGKPEEEQSEQ